MMDPQTSLSTNMRGGIRVVAAATATITIDVTGIMDEMVVGGEEGEGAEVVIMEVGTIDRHTGIGIVMTGDLYLLDDIYGVDEAGRGALPEDPGTAILHGGTTGPEIPPVSTSSEDLQLQQGQLQRSR